MSSMPGYIQVGPTCYRVTTDELDVLRREKELETGLFGYGDHKALIFGISSEAALDVQKETLMHEVLHALFWLVGKPLTTDAEEDVVARLSPLLLDTLQRNPTLVSYLTQTKEEPF